MNNVIPVSLIEKDYGSTNINFTYTNGGDMASDSIRIQLAVCGSAEGALVGDPLKPANLTFLVALSTLCLAVPTVV